MKSIRRWAVCLMIVLLPVTSSLAAGRKAKPKPIEFHDTVIESIAPDSIISRIRIVSALKTTFSR